MVYIGVKRKNSEFKISNSTSYKGFNFFHFMLTLLLTQLVRNIPGIFAQCSLSVTIFRSSREDLENILKENIILVLKVYDLTITNVDLLAKSSNHKAMFPKYSKNIPRISFSKIFQEYPRNIIRL